MPKPSRKSAALKGNQNASKHGRTKEVLGAADTLSALQGLSPKLANASKKRAGTPKESAAVAKRSRLLQLAPLEIEVNGKGKEAFPRAALAGCVTVDNLEDGEIGSGCCVDPDQGLILTAGHAAETVGAVRRVAFPSGVTVLAECVRVSTDYDLSLLLIQEPARSPYPYVRICHSSATTKAKLFCVGQPGVRAKQRLEANLGKVVSQTKRPLESQLEGGGLVHDCPVYGGCSGAPLLHAQTGELLGVHVCFDHNRFEAQAVTVEAVRQFIGS